MNPLRKSRKCAAALFVLAAATAAARADSLNLTSPGASGTINGALFVQISPQSTGTGVINPFVRLQNNGIESGYNTDFRPPEFNEKTDANFTRSLLLDTVPIVNVDGTNYRQFLLDINEQPAGDGRFLSLDALQIHLGAAGDLTGYPGGLGTLIYDLDAGGDNWINLDYSLNHGSGSGDMFAYIPSVLFTGSNQYVYLYSQFGRNFAAGAGFEEWSVLDSIGGVATVPEPSSFALMGAAALSFAGCVVRRRKA